MFCYILLAEKASLNEMKQGIKTTHKTPLRCMHTLWMLHTTPYFCAITKHMPQNITWTLQDASS